MTQLAQLPMPDPPALLETAAHHSSTAVPVAGPDELVGAVLHGLTGRRFDSAAVIAVCAGERLVGVITIERLLTADPKAALRTVMDADPPTVAPGTDQELAAWRTVEHGEPGLAVVDDDGRFRGLIPPQRLLAVLLAEHDEDLARLGGFLRTTAAARTASTEPVSQRLWHRLPWLLLGLAGALAAAGIVGAFERALERNVLIALFIPGVVYIADAVGTQTEALVIRGLSVGVGIRRVVIREVATGLLVGALLGCTVRTRDLAALARRRRGFRRRAGRLRRVVHRHCDRNGTALAVPATRPGPGLRIRPPRHRDPGPSVDRRLLHRGHHGRPLAEGVRR